MRGLAQRMECYYQLTKSNTNGMELGGFWAISKQVIPLKYSLEQDIVSTLKTVRQTTGKFNLAMLSILPRKTSDAIQNKLFNRHLTWSS